MFELFDKKEKYLKLQNMNLDMKKKIKKDNRKVKNGEK